MLMEPHATATQRVRPLGSQSRMRSPGFSSPASVGIGDTQVDGSHLRGVTGPICDNTHQLAGGWMAGTL
jgi:hypothetical protein